MNADGSDPIATSNRTCGAAMGGGVGLVCAAAMRDEASEGLTAMREKRTTSWAKRFPREALDQW
jgi:hypothetical protein